MGSFTVLHSSAGAGKTHALVKRYLVLALREREAGAYAAIMALTFTNKAAAEMRDRVLEYIEALASGKPLVKATEKDVLRSVMDEAGIDEAEVHRRAQAMLTHMLHHWSQLAVTTIDSFTRRVVMPFARELKLDQDLHMTTEEEYYRAKAIDLMLEETGGDSPLTQVLVATCEQLLEEERTWRVDRPLLELSKQLGREEAVEHLAELKETAITRFIEIRSELRERTDAFREHIRKLGKEVMDAVKEAGLDENDFPYKDKGYISFFRKLADFEDWTSASSRFITAREEDRWFARSTEEPVAEAITAMVPLLCRVYDEVEGQRDRMRQHALELAVMRDLLPTASLNSIAERLEQLKREDRVSFFSDLTRKVMAIVQKEPAPFLYERLGERYKHFLVDEFQDTSLMQWHAMLPLVENALASDGTVFLVGDAKQAIYRWRNGEVRQFTSFPSVFRKDMLEYGERFEQTLKRNHVKENPLVANYRSAAGIIGFNNELTGVLMAGLDPEDLVAYDGHAQTTVSAAEGYVEVSCYQTGKRKGDADPEEEDRSAKMKPWELMVQAVEDCLADGFSKGDIAVLVRSGLQGARAGRYLAEQGWEVIAPDGLTLGHSPVAVGIVHVLAWLQHRTDETLARAVQSIAVLGAKDVVDPFAGGRSPKELMEEWRGHHPHIHSRQPLVPLIARIGRALGHDPAADGFAMALLNEANAFAIANGDDLPGFLEHWERTGHARTAGGAPGGDAIQVMTVHKAKGLQFPVVIIPEAGRRTTGGGRERIWISPGPAMEGLPAALVQNKKVLGREGLGVPEAVLEDRLSRLDELNVLYVAITRPEQRLYISVPGSGGGFLSKAIIEHLALVPGDTWRSRPEPPPKEQGKAKDEPGPIMTLLPDPGSGDENLMIRREAPDGWDPADPDPFRSQGKAIHAILARVHTSGDLPAALERESTGWGLTAQATERLGKHLKALLDQPRLAPFYGDGLEVHTEATLLDEEGRAWRPDRVVRDGDHIRVLDIKTGRPSAAHKEQVKNYRELLQQVEGRLVESYLLYVREGELVRVDD